MYSSFKAELLIKNSVSKALVTSLCRRSAAAECCIDHTCHKGGVIAKILDIYVYKPPPHVQSHEFNLQSTTTILAHKISIIGLDEDMHSI